MSLIQEVVFVRLLPTEVLKLHNHSEHAVKHRSSSSLTSNLSRRLGSATLLVREVSINPGPQRLEDLVHFGFPLLVLTQPSLEGNQVFQGLMQHGIDLRILKKEGLRCFQSLEYSVVGVLKHVIIHQALGPLVNAVIVHVLHPLSLVLARWVPVVKCMNTVHVRIQCKLAVAVDVKVEKKVLGISVGLCVWDQVILEFVLSQRTSQCDSGGHLA